MAAAGAGERSAELGAHSVFVSVGTDHHPFDRLVGWADAWATRHPAADVFVQYGGSSPPSQARGVVQLPRSELLDRVRAANVVVAQGGPGGIIDIRACGKLPIVLPRDPAHGEHIDGHQLRFARHQAGHGRIALADDPAAVSALVEQALVTPEEFVVGPSHTPTAGTAAAVEELLAELLARPRRSLLRSWRRQSVI